jgi:FlaA1/EpsC-like NDP-sugar epimerase
MREVFREHRPTVVFHAAAYKHVGLMEENPVEAVRNNAIATRVMARVAGDTGTKVFVQVSTDKAVDPATVMGASKALAEWAAEAANARYEDTAYTSVRFGNVLNSSGSVVPIFRRQIEAGGPVTVTDPDMTRFFMTIPEAVQLVIRAGSLAQGGEVFVLEMGEPVRIMDLAEDMIRFSGLEPGRDIAIEIVGPRPGEKLHEDLFNPYEHPQETPAQRILRADRPRIDPAWVEETFDRIGVLTLEGDPAGLASVVAQLASLRLEPEEAVVLTTSPAAEEADGATA